MCSQCSHTASRAARPYFRERSANDLLVQGDGATDPNDTRLLPGLCVYDNSGMHVLYLP